MDSAVIGCCLDSALQICAEVVELADTPSMAVALLAICNILVKTLVSLHSITYSELPKTTQ